MVISSIKHVYVHCKAPFVTMYCDFNGCYEVIAIFAKVNDDLIFIGLLHKNLHYTCTLQRSFTGINNNPISVFFGVFDQTWYL